MEWLIGWGKGASDVMVFEGGLPSNHGSTLVDCCPERSLFGP